MNTILGDSFITHTGKIGFLDVVRSQVIALYFTAHWCPPCRAFTPLLIKFFNDVNERGKRLEVIFVSADKDQASYNDYYNTMPWIAIPYGDSRVEILQ